MIDILLNPIIQKALIAGILASFASGIMGSYVVIKRISSISGSISHSILGGIGLAIFLSYKFSISLSPILGALIAAIIAALLIGWMHLKHRQTEDATIATIWSTGMGLGVIFISLVPTYGEDLHHFLFGSVLEISNPLIYTLLIFDILIFLTVMRFYRQFLLICFDEEQAKLQNIHINALYLLLLSLISISIVLLIQIIGIILVIAVITIPPTISSMFTKKLFFMMIFAFLICAVITTSGIVIASLLNYPPGATAAILAAIFYLISLIFQRCPNKKFL